MYIVKFQGKNRLYSQEFCCLQAARAFSKCLNRRCWIEDEAGEVVARYAFGQEMEVQDV